MDNNDMMAVRLAITALRNALLSKKVLSQEEIDHAVGDLFAKIALDKTLGARTELLQAFDVPKIERAVRAMLHPGGYREDRRP
jgi:hypothetical protein